MRLQTPFLALGLLLVWLALGGCTPAKTIEATGKIAKIAMNPDLPVGGPGDQPSVATITLYAEPGVNRNEFGEAAPVDVMIFQLSDDGKLLTSDFFTLTGEPRSALSTSYVSHKELQVAPGRSKILPAWKLKEDTSMIGVAVAYADIDRVNWRAAEPVNATGENYNILIPIRGRSVSVQIHR